MDAKNFISFIDKVEENSKIFVEKIFKEKYLHFLSKYSTDFNVLSFFD